MNEIRRKLEKRRTNSQERRSCEELLFQELLRRYLDAQFFDQHGQRTLPDPFRIRTTINDHFRFYRCLSDEMSRFSPDHPIEFTFVEIIESGSSRTPVRVCMGQYHFFSELNKLIGLERVNGKFNLTWTKGAVSLRK